MDRRPRLIAITGGSGAGKSWLADRLQRAFGAFAERLSLDSFYLDRAHLPPTRRARINFDHPRAIDWPRVEAVLCDCRAGRPANVPQYSFATHTRLIHERLWTPAPLILMDGLWLLSRPRVRALFDLRIYLECPGQLRLERRLARDVAERGRTPDSVREQFWKEVAPMHDRHVVSQLRHADIVLQQPPSDAEIHSLIETLSVLAPDAVPVVNDQPPAFPLPIAQPPAESVGGGTRLASVHPMPHPTTVPAAMDDDVPLRRKTTGLRTASGGAMDVLFIGSMDSSPTGFGCPTISCYD